MNLFVQTLNILKFILFKYFTRETKTGLKSYNTESKIKFYLPLRGALYLGVNLSMHSSSLSLTCNGPLRVEMLL